MTEWPTLALDWYGARRGLRGHGRSDLWKAAHLLSVHPAGVELISGWLMTLAVIACGIAIFFSSSAGAPRARSPAARRGARRTAVARAVVAYAALLLMIAVRVYLGRFDNLFNDQTIFTGVNYTDAHVTLTGLLLVSIALVARRSHRGSSTRSPRHGSGGSSLPSCRPLRCYVVVSILGWYVNGFIVKPNELVRESPYIAHNIQMTRQAFGLNRITQRAFPGRDGRRGGRTPPTTARRSTTSASGTGARCRTRSARSRKSAPTTTSPTSTSIATRSTAACAR